ncbi:MAG: hypothetical protein ACTSUE_04320 [Promethearchaeota archaeon]
MPDDNIDDELAALRRKRMAEMMKQQQVMKLEKEIEENAGAIFEQKLQAAISFLLAPEAYTYLQNMKQRNKRVHDVIINRLFPPEVMMSIDKLLYVIRLGRVPRGIISIVEIQQLEREILGIKSSISYKKRGEKERVKISSLFKSDD